MSPVPCMHAHHGLQKRVGNNAGANTFNRTIRWQACRAITKIKYQAVSDRRGGGGLGALDAVAEKDKHVVSPHVDDLYNERPRPCSVKKAHTVVTAAVTVYCGCPNTALKHSKWGNTLG